MVTQGSAATPDMVADRPIWNVLPAAGNNSAWQAAYCGSRNLRSFSPAQEERDEQAGQTTKALAPQGKRELSDDMLDKFPAVAATVAAKPAIPAGNKSSGGAVHNRSVWLCAGMLADWLRIG